MALKHILNYIVQEALNSPKVQRGLEGKDIIKIIYVPNKILNFVTKERNSA